MDICIGAEVRGTDGKLGEVHRVIVDARSSHVTDLVVKHGFAFGRERVVPLSSVTKVENGVVVLSLDQRGFEAMNGYADDRYRAPDPNYIGPPGFNNREFMLDEVVSYAGAAGVGGAPGTAPPLGFPGGQQVSADDMARPVYQSGTPVHDSGGEKIGEVEQMRIDAESGAPTHIVLRRGFLFHHEAELPLDWVQDLSDKGIQLNVTREAVEERFRQVEARR